ncbi:hypothetical protein [Candidatus Nitrospira bockiana]
METKVMISMVALAVPLALLAACAAEPERRSMDRSAAMERPPAAAESPDRHAREARPAPSPSPTEPSGTSASEPPVVRERTIVIVPTESKESEVSLRQQEEAQAAKIGDITEYEADFRRNYETNFADTGYGYDQFRPAYHYGYELAKDPATRNLDWDSLERTARRGWTEATMGPWDRYKDAVRYAWERVRQGKG